MLTRRAGSPHSIFFAFEPLVFLGRRLNAAAPSKKRAAQKQFYFSSFSFFGELRRRRKPTLLLRRKGAPLIRYETRQ